MDFVERVYVITRAFPREELYGLSAQLRRASVGIPSNVSEGHQHPTKAFIHYLAIALGSLAEAETQLEIAIRLRRASPDDVAPVLAAATRLRQLLHGLRRSLKNRSA